jgi:hypothetical protein
MTVGSGAGELNGRAQRAVAYCRGGGRLKGIRWGGSLVIVGITMALTWTIWAGQIVILLGLIAFAGLTKGKWFNP